MAKGKKNNIRMDKIGVFLSIVLSLSVIIGICFAFMSGGLNPAEISSFVILVFIVIGAGFITMDRYRNVKAGLPIRDEMERKINWRAGYYGFIAAIWSAVFGPLSIDILFGYELEGSRVTALVVLVSAITFVLSYIYFRRKGMQD